MWFASSFGALVTSVLLHAAAARIAPLRNRVVMFLLIGTPIGLMLALINAASFGWTSAKTLAAVVFYAFLCELYLFLFTLALASISANLLITLRGGAMRQEDIQELYDSRSMVAIRFNRLISTGLICLRSAGLEAEGYELTARGERLLGALNALRRTFRHE